MPLRRADDILEWLLARQPDTRFLEKTTGLPYGWGLWLRALSPLPRPFRASEVLAELAQRAPLPQGGRLPELSFVQAMRRLLWQGWDPAPRDQRWMRWTSAVISALLHLMFALLLLWVALIRPPSEPEQGGESGRVQVAFVGRGTPQQEEGSQPPAAEPASAEAAIAAAMANAQAMAQAEADAREPSASAPQPAATPAPPSEPQPAPPSPATPAVEQPVQATDVAQATSDFVVPPTSVPRTEVRVVTRDPQDIAVRERTVVTVEAPTPRSNVPTPRPVEPQLRTPEVSVQERQVTVIEAPAPAVRVPGPQVDASVRQRELQVREREIRPVTAPAVTVATLPTREVTLPGRSPEVAVRERAVPNAAPRPAPPSPTAPSSTATASAPSTPPGATRAPGNRASTPAGSPASQAAAASGNWATPNRADDWGAANHPQDADLNGRAVSATGKSGGSLFNADGSVRVPGQAGTGNTERGAPGGEKDGWSKERIAQSGTWLKRPPYDYTPTSFDKYWAPNESLLAEWVRKGIKAVEIPIPGTSSTISCVISVLQFGGGCGLSDPNMQDQPAIARPPPDIPFKKELQEDNGSR
ncbi:hypothetical protein EDF74_2971 [Stenotrophomonas rhizophila]|uniref:hypothetical protein n=1 Tax=Stenotrophomonas rhizophila TaxID=216778 RepID=UPI000F4B2B65|nr:hypothetical protein [Stenotrophomonas rhizophila]ROP77295.1 hypothetical protein EDF74_2971 [Stenotrophomonas rhizophila]